MRAWSVRLCVVVVAVSVVLAGAPASAGTRGRWDRFSPTTHRSTDEPVLQRTSDGRLHVIWPHRSPQGDRLNHRVISPGGALGDESTVQSGWSFISNPDVVADGDGLRLLFGGTRTADSQETHRHLNTATAPRSGSPWTLNPESVTTGDFVAASDIGAAVAADGTVFQAWTASTGVFVHRALAPGENHNYQTQFSQPCCSYNADLAVDGGSGKMWVAWYTDSGSNIGVYVNEVDTATGAPVGAARKMPGSSTTFDSRPHAINSLARIPITGRRGRSGVFVAYPGGYPATDRVLVWRVGASSPMVVGRTSTGRPDDVALSADGQGRLWVLWTQRAGDGSVRVFARRSNPDVTTWGRTVSIAAPSGTTDVWKLVAAAQANRVDVVALARNGAGTATWHTQIHPGLRMGAKPRRFSGKRRVTFRIRDAGVPVRRALVKVADRSGRTDSDGLVRLVVGPYSKPRRVVAVANKAGFTGHRIVLRVRPR